MIYGFRWIKTAPDVWQFEGPSGSRRFHGMVNVRRDGTATFALPGGYSVYRYPQNTDEEHGQGERPSVRVAKNEIEKHIRAAKTEGR